MKIIASDLDGTLLNKFYKSDEKIDACVKQVLDSENEFVIVTGRTVNGLNLLSLANLPIYKIVLNGSLVLGRNNETIQSFSLSEEIIQTISQEYPKVNVEYICDEKIYMTITKDQFLREHYKWDYWRLRLTNEKGEIDFSKLAHYEFETSVEDILSKDILKINILQTNKDLMSSCLAFAQKLPSVSVVPFQEVVIEITPLQATKENALNYVLDLNNWLADDTYVFGDGENDVGMLEIFKHSYAPFQSGVLAKAAAKKVLKDEEYSVINEIERIIKI